jgi:iron complex outermembrane receptor protein
MDGQRLVAENPLQTVPDPSSIPPAAIERIEIVADGSSAIYGSDAVAGVINIILRKNLDGAETQLRQGWGKHGYDAIDLSQALGKVWSTGSAMVVIGHTENTHVANYDLPYYTEDLRPFGGVDLRPHQLRAAESDPRRGYLRATELCRGHGRALHARASQ